MAKTFKSFKTLSVALVALIAFPAFAENVVYVERTNTSYDCDVSKKGELKIVKCNEISCVGTNTLANNKTEKVICSLSIEQPFNKNNLTKLDLK